MRGVALIAVASVLAGVAAEAQAVEFYSRQPTWAASMVATRRNMEQAQVKDLKAATPQDRGTVFENLCRKPREN